MVTNFKICNISINSRHNVMWSKLPKTAVFVTKKSKNIEMKSLCKAQSYFTYFFPYVF